MTAILLILIAAAGPLDPPTRSVTIEMPSMDACRLVLALKIRADGREVHSATCKPIGPGAPA